MTNERAIQILRGIAGIYDDLMFTSGGDETKAIDLAIDALQKQAKKVICKDCKYSFPDGTISEDTTLCTKFLNMSSMHGSCDLGEEREE